MKEAAGEANLTVVAIILIAVVVAVATPIIRSLMKTATYRSCCTDAGMVWKNGKCQSPASAKCVDVEESMWPSYVTCTKNADSSARPDLHYVKVACES